MKQLKYQVEDATLAEVLGISNFTNAESAVLELVKNAYDAGAPELTITFERDKMTLADTGKGMNAADIEEYWMHVGKTSKGYTAIDENGEERVQAGSKGVGRFALARLGSQVLLRSKKGRCKGVVWKTDWATSSLDDCSLSKTGTVIEVSGLRDNWTHRAIENLRSYLSRTYNDNKMSITIVTDDAKLPVTRYFDKPKLGINCVEVIRFSFDAEQLKIDLSVESDEFKASVAKIVNEVDIRSMSTNIDAVAELFKKNGSEISEKQFRGLLTSVGSFDGELYFRLSSVNKIDAEKYQYKHEKLVDSYDRGVVLYRNAFSIATYEGSKDWIGLGERARKSPAGPGHPTGSWRVRSNQLSGFVRIDKKENPLLRDLANRQGIEENDQYKLLLAIISCILKAFERYRQSIMRPLARAYEAAESAEQQPKPISYAIVSGTIKRKDLDDSAFDDLREELRDQKERDRQREEETRELEERHSYDTRILNVLATAGLKASSVAHQLKNDGNNIARNSAYVRQALQRYGLWEQASSTKNTSRAWRSIPYLLDEGERINGKFIAFIRAMLGDIEKGRFDQSECDLNTALAKIADRWEHDYAQAKIHLSLQGGFNLAMPEDVVQVIFDNLILNSLQQNEELQSVAIEISVEEQDSSIVVTYSDNGVGLDNRYSKEPTRILEVHETNRQSGHGLGMWIVNNSLLNYQCEVIHIGTGDGFSISFTMKGR